MLTTNIVFRDLALIDYKKAWDYQQQLFNTIMEQKLKYRDTQNPQDYPANLYFLFCEHPHVYTLGKSGQQNNLLINDDFLKKINATYYKTDRGGDITYHGPGQIVGYPIVDLDLFNMQLREYIFKLEESIILCLNDF